MAQGFHHLLPPNPPKEPSDRFVVWTVPIYRPDIDEVLSQLMDEAQSEASTFRPDDLAEELLDARKRLAVAPDQPPALCIYSDQKAVYSADGTPLFLATHVLPGAIVNLWYVLWDKEEYVGICRLEPNQSRGNTV